MLPEPLRVWLYCRVSNDPTGRGLSVSSQEDELRAWAEREGWRVVGVTTDNDMSASRTKRSRPGYREIHRLVAAGAMDILAVWESSRAQRDLAMFVQTRELCEQHGVRFAYKGRTYNLADTNDRFSASIDAVIDERYADETRERVNRGLRSALKRGTARGKIPFGYRRTYDPGTGALLEQTPDPDTAPIVQELFRRIIAGDGLYTIAKDLNARGIPTPQESRDTRRGVVADRGGWTSSKIRRQVGNPNVAGYRVHQRKIYGESSWEPLVSPADFELVSTILANPARRTQNGVEPRYLLSGLIECGVCGAKCRRITNHGRPSYACHGRDFNNTACVSIRQEPTEDFVVRAFLAALESPSRMVEMVEDKTAEVVQAVKELAGYEAKLAQFRESALKDEGGISVESLAAAEAHYGPRIAEARRRATPAWIPSVVLDLAEGDTREEWEGLDLAQRRSALGTMLRITVAKSTRPAGTHGFDRSRIRIEWRAG